MHLNSLLSLVCPSALGPRMETKPKTGRKNNYLRRFPLRPLVDSQLPRGQRKPQAIPASSIIQASPTHHASPWCVFVSSIRDPWLLVNWS